MTNATPTTNLPATLCPLSHGQLWRAGYSAEQRHADRVSCPTCRYWDDLPHADVEAWVALSLVNLGAVATY